MDLIVNNKGISFLCKIDHNGAALKPVTRSINKVLRLVSEKYSLKGVQLISSTALKTVVMTWDNLLGEETVGSLIDYLRKLGHNVIQ